MIHKVIMTYRVTKTHRVILYLLLAILGTFATTGVDNAGAAGDEIVLKVKAKPNRVPPKSTFRLSITITGNEIRSIPEPKLPRLTAFNIVGKSSSQRISLSGSLAMSVTKISTFQVEALREGVFTIEPITVEHKGKTYKSEPITITVDPNAPRPKAAQTVRRRAAPSFPDFDMPQNPAQSRKELEKDDLIVEMTVSDKIVVPLETVIATFNFYSAVTLIQSPRYIKPKFEGFIVEDLPFENGEMQLTGMDERNGKEYQVSKIRYALLPITQGVLTVDPATLLVYMEPWSERITLFTKEKSIEVSPYPVKERPSDFLNMTLSDVRISANLDTHKAQVNEGLKLQLTITGRGYIKPAEIPETPKVDGLEFFEPKIEDVIEKSGGVLRSKRIIEYPVLAREEGKHVIDPIKISLYDPVLGHYLTFKTKPLAVQVSGGSSLSIGAAPTDIKGKDSIRYIKPDRKHLKDYSHPLYTRSLFWMLLLLPLPMILVSLKISARLNRMITDVAYARGQRAAGKAKAKLKELEGMPPSIEFSAKLDMAIREYLADHWNISAPGVTGELVALKLSPKPDLADGFTRLLSSVEMARYSPGSAGDMKAQISEAHLLIDKMEEANK